MRALANTNLRTVANFEKLHAFDWLFRSQFGSCVTLDRRNRKHQMTAENKHVLRQNQRSDKWDVYANTEGNVFF